MDIPIGDAITVAYVDVVHAHSELIHIDWETLSKEEILAEVLEAMHDLENALDMMKPHAQKIEGKPGLSPGELTILIGPETPRLEVLQATTTIIHPAPPFPIPMRTLDG